MPHISFSELKNWNFCPFYHKLTYIDKLKGFTGNEYTAFGTAIHDVAEKKILQESFEAPEYFLQRFEECLAELDSDIEFREDPEKMAVQAMGIIPEIGSKFMLFVDCHLVDELNGIQLKLCTPREETLNGEPYSIESHPIIG